MTKYPKLNGLDHLRSVAILYVFLFHYQILSHGKPDWLIDFAKFGWTGVDLFFVLSGFLISSQLFTQIKKNERISFSTFFLKRFFRIIPAYLVVVLIYFLVPDFREKEALPPIWKFLTFTQNLGLNLQEYGTFSHAWSLCVEEHFYLVLPLCLIVLQTTGTLKRAYWIVIVLFIFGFFIRTYSFDQLYLPEIAKDNSWMYWYKFIYYTTYSRLDGLLVGVGVASVYQFLPAWWNKISGYGNWFIGFGILILIGACYLCDDPMSYQASVFGFPLVAVGYGLIVTGAICPTSFLFKWNSSVTTFIATVSYALYLTHKGIVHIVHELLADYNLNDNLLLLISFAACLLGALLLNLAVEKPFMKLREKVLQRK